MRYKIFKIFQFLVFLTILNNCYSLEVNLQESQYELEFSDNMHGKIAEIEIDYTNFYWFGNEFSSNKTVLEAINLEMKKYPGAKGIKKIQITYYNKSWFSFSFLPNPLGMFSAGLWIYIGYPLGFTNKSVYIKGEVF